MALYQFPGTDFHDLNLDWLLSQMKTCLAEWASTQEDWETLRTDNAAFVARITAEWESVREYINNYFDNLDVQEEVSLKLDTMANDGTLLNIVRDTVQASSGTAATAWMNEHISQETGYVIDTSLTVAEAAADAKVTGDKIRQVSDSVLQAAYYNGTSASIFPYPRMGVAVSSVGRYAINQANNVINGISANSVFLYANSTFMAKPGYTISYAFWTVPVYSATPLENRIGNPVLNLTAGNLVTVPQDCYVLISAKHDDSSPFDSEDPVTNFDEAVTINLYYSTVKDKIANDNNQITYTRTINQRGNVFKAQQAVAQDWHFPFVDMYDALGLGSNHVIPGTATIWSPTGTTDLNQRQIWMSDGTHPYRGVGLVDMFGRTISQQIKMISPSYHTSGDASTDWTGKEILWMGTSIPAGSDPDAGSGTGATYPQMVASALGATVHNISRGSSMMRINASTGTYTGIVFSHFLRALTRTTSEIEPMIINNWATIHNNISNAPAELTEDHVNVMIGMSFETLLMPYLNGTRPMPDLFVIDHGHNDKARGINGNDDMWIIPSVENISNGILAEDTYMTNNNYAGLVSVFGSLDGITDKAAFAASVNRNCFQGACNFLITLILKYNPYARIIIISDYN